MKSCLLDGNGLRNTESTTCSPKAIEVSNETNQGREVPQRMLTPFLRTAPNTDHWGRDPLHSPEAESIVPWQSCSCVLGISQQQISADTHRS